MKNCAFLVASAVVCASASVFADNVQGANVFGVLTVESTAADTLVAVPWCECSVENDQPVAISNIVKTANLTEGDTLYALNSNRETVNTWTLNAAGYWVSDKQVTEEGVDNTISAAQAHANRGTAIILHRKNPSVGKIYLYGQVGSSSSSISTTIEPGSSSTPAYTLIAPPSVSDVDVVSCLDGPQNGDSIVVRNAAGVNREYTYNATSEKWEYTKRTWDGTSITTTTNEVTSITLTKGFGAWYVSRNTTVPTLTW